MIRERKINIPVIPCSFRVIIFDDEKEIENRFKNYIIEDLGTFHAGVFETDDSMYVVFKKGEWNDGIIVHESNHILNRCFKWIKYDLNIDNDEMQSYFLQFIFNKIKSFLDSNIT